ncbi:hypothetical protein [Kangiella sp. M94]
MNINKLSIFIYLCALISLKANGEDNATIKETLIASKHAVMISEVLKSYSVNWESDVLKAHFAFDWMFSEHEERYTAISKKYVGIGSFKKCDFYQLADMSKELIEGAMFYKAKCTFGETVLKSEFIVLELEGKLKLAHLNLTDE